jgi:16S rRNA (guanine527-N7)-methyltransferase
MPVILTPSKLVPNPFQTLNRHVKISHEIFDRLSIYHDLLLKWQPKINLVGPDTIPDCWNRHFLDSLQLIPYIDDLKKTMVDMGSGAGFPGMVIAIVGGRDVHLVESDARKIIFLKEVARLTHTNVTIHHGRIENTVIEDVGIILSRACAPLDALLSLSSFYISHGTDCLFHKGKNYSNEIEDAKEHWSFTCNAFPSVTDTQGVILKLSDIGRKENESGRPEKP